MKHIWEIWDKTEVVYLDPRHVDYWREHQLPVIVCWADLKVDEIRWRSINELTQTDKGYKADFRDAEKLDSSSKTKLENLGKERDEDIDRRVGYIENEVNRLTYCDPSYAAADPNREQQVQSVYNSIDELSSVVKVVRKSLGDERAGALAQRLHEAEFGLRRFETAYVDKQRACD